MITGTGIDITEFDRIKQLVERQPRFPKRVLTERELHKYHSYQNDRRKMEFLAGRYAAKEAYSKAVGCGIGEELSFQSIEILSNEKGQPHVNLNGQKQSGTHISISHSDAYAVAQVIIEQV
ncbi:holo-[acyl-carrier protein] synthase [Alkalibacillus filiformis]|uniref:Holo-[acyl-carrier-protein] synthase n=1 Tax=Alkalibacillus filiformis TaxID=200990 RepID=A0ABU0DWZ5_9BACI|nr:holo-ACP synthase [Alkalibacillus filiformis]MDQ0352971.1 holo-[acyl-carrier protein] synthase [Alkalibacillus filiformis]